MAKYNVEQGDCISSIAYEHGLFWETVWNHAENSQLKQKRKDPNVLYPGDEVFIPDKEEKQESCSCEKKHRFRRKGIPTKLRMQILKNGKPRANASYILDIDGEVSHGTLDSKGILDKTIPSNAQKAHLQVGLDHQTFEIALGGLDPIDEISGVQVRLNNLGYSVGEPSGTINEKTRSGIKLFQKVNGLSETGLIDSSTRSKLQQLHGS
jgi:hypothetical protein